MTTAMATHPHGRLRGSQAGRPLSRRQHELLYQRAMTGSLKDAALVCGMAPDSAHGSFADIFSKLGVDDITGAYRAMGWLKPERPEVPA